MKHCRSLLGSVKKIKTNETIFLEMFLRLSNASSIYEVMVFNATVNNITVTS